MEDFKMNRRLHQKQLVEAQLVEMDYQLFVLREKLGRAEEDEILGTLAWYKVRDDYIELCRKEAQLTALLGSPDILMARMGNE